VGASCKNTVYRELTLETHFDKLRYMGLMAISSRSILVLMLAVVCYGGGMLLWTTRSRRAANIKPVISYGDVLFWGFVGFGFGLVANYGWRIFHRPVLYLTLLAVIGIAITATLGPAARISR
jgi:hypothetical protein